MVHRRSRFPLTRYMKNHVFTPDMYRTNRGDRIRASEIDQPGNTFGLGGQTNTNFDPLKPKKIRGAQ